MRDYLRDPEAIYARSFAIAEEESDLSGIEESLRPVVLRLVHAAGDPAIARLVTVSPGALDAGKQALKAGATILTDCEMVAAGITRRLLPNANEVVCMLGDPCAAGLARERQTTRSAAAVEVWGNRAEGAVVAIGNAPTALFRLVELIEAGAPKPALVIAMSVGFVGAAESKQALVESAIGVEYIAVSGRRGGSALAAATVNALAIEAGK